MISTQTLAESARIMEQVVLVDRVQVFNVGPQTTVGTHVTRELTQVGEPVPGLVQTTTLENAAESSVASAYSIKVSARTALSAGQAVRVITCAAEPSLVGKTLLVDKVSQNGLAVIRKAVATDTMNVNQEGKVLS